jgi:hypothetical protein
MAPKAMDTDIMAHSRLVGCRNGILVAIKDSMSPVFLGELVITASPTPNQVTSSIPLFMIVTGDQARYLGSKLWGSSH